MAVPARSRWGGFRGLVLLAALVSASCTEVELVPLGSLSPDTVSLRGEFCTSPPAETNQPVRVLFAVDYSNSMVNSDPKGEIVQAMEAVTKQFQSVEYITFGILRWGEKAVRELTDCKLSMRGMPLFTRDQAALKTAFDRLSLAPDPYKNDCTVGNVPQEKYLGGSDYQLALNEIRKYVEDDMAMAGPPASFYQYHIVFMTDGMPQSGTTTPQDTVRTLLSSLGQMSILIQSYTVRLDVVSVVKIQITAPEFANLLPSMAYSAKGIYLQLNSPAAFAEGFAQILEEYRSLKEYELASFNTASAPRALLVSNRNVRVAKVGGTTDVFLDSDGDGLVDEFERELGTNPVKGDSDGDGLDDYFEYVMRPRFDPNRLDRIDLTATDLADDDGDGFTNYMEKLYKSDPRNADTDGDVLPDGYEYMAGTNPLTKDLEADPDDDGISNIFEIRQHINPLAPEDETLRRKRSYKGDIIDTPYRVQDGRRCYRFLIENISIGETRPAQDATGLTHPAGLNTIDVWRIERPILTNSSKVTSSMMRFIHGQARIIFRASVPMRDPPALELRIDNDDFPN